MTFMYMNWRTSTWGAFRYDCLVYAPLYPIEPELTTLGRGQCSTIHFTREAEVRLRHDTNAMTLT